MRFPCRITKIRTQTPSRNISYLLLHNWLIPSDLVIYFTATRIEDEKLRNDLFSICKESHEQKNIFVSMQRLYVMSAESANCLELISFKQLHL